MAKNMLAQVKKVLDLMGKDKWIYIVMYLVVYIIQGFATYFLMASACQYLLDGGLLGDWKVFQKGLHYVVILCLIICIILPVINTLTYMIKDKLNRNLRSKIFDHLLKLPISFFETHTSSGIIGLILNNLDGVSSVIDTFWEIVMQSLVLGSIAIYSLIHRGFVSGVFIIISFASLTCFISIRFVSKVRRESDKSQTKLGGTNHIISDLFGGIVYQKIYNASELLYKNFKKDNDMYINAIKGVAIKNDASNCAKGLIGDTQYLTILILGILLMIRGDKTIGEVMALLSITNTLYFLMANLFMLMQNSQVSLVCADKIIDFLNQPEDINVHNQMNKGDCHSLIEFRDVSFQYKKGNTILKDVVLNIDKGEKVNLVGYSGNGKSTLIKLILGFYKNYQGSIMIDGFEIRDTSNHKIRQYISYVSQENLLFNCSVKENIRYGKLDATDEEIIQVAKQVGLHHFIMSLPEKYDTIVKFGGGNFSKEECSKIAIARAMIKQAPIVVLDEAMAKINPKNEAEIKAVLDKLTHGKTVINIAHKLDSIAQSERIIIFENGRIVEDGIKKDLLAKNSILRKYSGF